MAASTLKADINREAQRVRYVPKTPVNPVTKSPAATVGGHYPYATGADAGESGGSGSNTASGAHADKPPPCTSGLAEESLVSNRRPLRFLCCTAEISGFRIVDCGQRTLET
jgi:hypothetical protein